jgi:methionine-gamma-lyase
MLTNKDHIIFSNITYIAAYRLLNELFNNKFGVETTIVDTTNIKDVKSVISPNTKLIHIETHGNPTISISDISAIAKLAHEMVFYYRLTILLLHHTIKNHYI